MLLHLVRLFVGYHYWLPIKLAIIVHLIAFIFLHVNFN